MSVNIRVTATVPAVPKEVSMRSDPFAGFGITWDRLPARSLIAVVNLIAEGITGQAHGSLRRRQFGRLIIAFDRLGRPMWCSWLPG